MATSPRMLVVVRKQHLSETVCSLTLGDSRGQRLPDWTPGAHIDLVLPTGDVRQYSLCGDRWDAYTYRVAVLREPSGRGGSRYIHDCLEPGDTVSMGGLRNNFSMVPAKRYIFIAGGIGITPILPMVRQAAMLNIEFTLFYGGRSRSSMAFLDELQPLGERVVVWPEDEVGLMDLTAALGNPDDKTSIYCCGPAPLLAAVESQCSPWRSHALRVERFVEPERDAPSRSKPFTVQLAHSGAEVMVEKETSVLHALRQIGCDILSSCEQGICGTCEVGVLGGVPDHRDSLLEEHERSAGDVMFVCVSRSITDRLVLDL